MFDRDMRYLAASDRYLTDYRLGNQDIVGRSHYEVFPEIPERWKKIHQRCLAGAVEKAEKDPFPRADGTLDYVRWEIQPWRTDDGEIGGIFLFSEVVTERVRAEEALQESEARYRLIAENSSDVIWLLDINTKRFTYVSPSVHQLRGFTVNEVLQQTMQEVMTPESYRMISENLPKRLAAFAAGDESARTQIHEVIQTRKDGSTVPTEVVTTLLTDANNRVIHIQGITRDITERKKAGMRQQHLVNVLRAIRNVNQLITQEKDPDALVQKTCGLLTETRGYPSAWVSLRDNAGRMYIAGASGVGTGLEALQAQIESGALPLCCSRAVTEPDIVVVHDQAATCNDCALAREYSGMAALAGALRHGEHNYGMIVVALPPAMADDVEEQSLFREVAGDIGLALHAIESRRERALVIEELRQSEALYHSLFDNMLNGLAYCRMLFDGDRPQDFVYLSVNRAFTKQTGLHNVLGKRVTEVIPGIRETSPQVFEIYGRVARTGVPERFETYVEPLRMWFEVSVFSPARDHFVAVFDVITERKKAETALRESEAKYRTLFETMADGVVYQDKNGKIISINPAAEKIMGLSFDKIKGATSLDPRWKSIHEDGSDFPGQTHPSMVALGTGRQVNNVIMGIHNPEKNETRWININAVPEYREGDSEPYQVYTTISDITERKRAEQETVNSRNFLDSIIEQSPHPMWISDEEGTLIRINKACCDLLQIAPEGVVGKYNVLEDNIVEEQGMMHLVRSVFEEGEIVNFDLIYDTTLLKIPKLERAARVILNVTIFPVRNTVGKFINAVIQHVDITERKKTEAALRESEERYRSLVETTSDWVWQVNSMGRYTHVSAKVQDILGYAPEEVVGRTPFDFMEAEEARRVGEIFSEIVAQRRPFSLLENINIHRDGRSVVLETSGVPVFGPGGEFLGYRGMDRDITERKQALLSLEQESQKNLALLRNASDGIHILDASGCVIEASDSFCRMLGYERSEVIGMHVSLWDAGYSESEIPVKLREQLEHPVRSLFETKHRRKDGSVFDVEVSGYPLKLGDRMVLFNSSRDITERKRMEEEQEKLQAQFIQAQKMESVGRLAGGVAHDFNNILMAQKGYCDLMKAQLRPEDPLYEGLAQIDACADRAAALTRQLLVFSRRNVLQSAVFDLNGLVVNLDNMLRRLIGEDVALTTRPAEQPAMVTADPGQIEQVLVNLAVNARDAMPQGGKLTIEVSLVELDAVWAAGHMSIVPGQHVMLAVSDTGCGMDDETKSRIFEPFFTTKAEGKGTGLGLATVYGIVRQSNGSIRVYSEPGQGTTFKIYLPHVDAVPLERDRRDAEIVRGNGEQVLVVEDEPMLRDLAKLLIENLGYRASIAANGGAALIMIEEQGMRPDVLITDVVMPGMSGRVLVERLRRTVPDLRVIYMSGYTDDAIVNHGILNEGIDFLQKPFTMVNLAAKIRSALKKK